MLENLDITKDFSKEEKELVGQARVSQDSAINQTQVIAQIYVARKFKESIDQLIEANKEVSQASERYAKSLNRATWALAIVTLALVAVGVIQLFTA
ncbi:MAG: hypothetical protein KDE46_07840 [Caldilineaceae bacterium]|nr:hypothetical protein [Caldilineaceae bacterium]